MKANEGNFGEEVKKAIGIILSATHEVAVAAIAQAFNVSEAIQPTAERSRTSSKKAVSPRILPEETRKLSEKFYQAVCADPGQTMMVLAPRLETIRDKLVKPVAHLKREGKIKTTGERHLTRYFPL
jgi:hypothetical protein